MEIRGGGPHGEGVYPAFDVNSPGNVQKLADLNKKSFVIVTTSKATKVLGSWTEVELRWPNGARYVAEAKHADGRTVYVDTSEDPSDVFGKMNHAECPTHICTITVRVNSKGKTEVRFKFERNPLCPITNGEITLNYGKAYRFGGDEPEESDGESGSEDRCPP